jgi:parvulin-like peptidyl-prolyl isomerase
LPVLLLGVALLTACKKPAITDPNDPAFIVAGKDDWTITRAQLNAEVDNALKQENKTRADVAPAQMPALDTQILRYLVLKKLLLDKAATMKLPDIDKEVNQAIDYAKNRNPQHTYTDQEFVDLLKSHGLDFNQWKQNLKDLATMQAVIDAETAKDTQPTEQEVDAIYNEHKDAFQVPAMIRASRVLILVGDTDTAAQKADKKKQISAARARVMKGEDFSKVAMEVSEDRSSAPKGGDMGKFPRGTNEAGFDDVVFNTKVNSVSPVFLDSLGYQFVKVTDSTPAGVIPLAEARSIIGPKLAEAKKRKVANEYAENLLKTSGVTFYLKPVELPTAPAAPGMQPPPPAPAPAPAPAPDAQLNAPNLSATNAAPNQ